MIPARWLANGPSLRERLRPGIAAWSLFLAGCDPSEAIPYADQRCAVFGEVLLDGEPLEAGTISFESYGEDVKGMTVKALIIKGVYRFESRNGPVAGENRCEIEVEGAAGPVEGTSSVVEIQPDSPEALNIELTTSKPAGR